VSKLKKNATDFPAGWVQLKAALLRIMSITGSRDLALFYLNRDLRSGRLGSLLVESDGKETLLDWQQRTVQAPFNPEEGVGVEPYVDGHFYVRAVDLYKHYTPTMTAAPQSDDIRPPERRAADASGTRKRRQSLLQEILEVILRRYYPQGVPANTSTSAVQQKVAAAWKQECQSRGCKPTVPPNWDTIARRLGRRRH
jgi:hypothetical protein